MPTEEIQSILQSNLTTEQYDAVVDENKHILCLACAGSGKSRTLAYKIAYLLSKGESPESIIAFTFTEKAAESIKRRVAEALHKFNLPENYIGAIFIGTLDAFCHKLLGDINAKFRQYDILDRNGLILFLMSRYHKFGFRNTVGRYFKDKILPLVRWGAPEDVAEACYAFCSGAMEYVTGQSINVDGGFHIRRL